MAKTEPAYSDRDLQVIRSANHIVLKAWIGGDWREQVITPAIGQTMADFLEETQQVVASKPEYKKALIYLANQTGRVSMPKGFVPAAVREVTI